jgi:hypothetical protein
VSRSSAVWWILKAWKNCKNEWTRKLRDADNDCVILGLNMFHRYRAIDIAITVPLAKYAVIVDTKMENFQHCFL